MWLWFIFQAPLLAESIDRQPLKNIKPNLDWREVAYIIKARPVNQYYNCGHTPEGLPEAIAKVFYGYRQPKRHSSGVKSRDESGIISKSEY